MGRPHLGDHAIETPERLLVAAEDVFAQFGVEKATLADIAARAGITRPSLLYHFDTKERLYDAVVVRAFSALGEILMSSISMSGGFIDRFQAVVEAFITYVSVHPQL